MNPFEIEQYLHKNESKKTTENTKKQEINVFQKNENNENFPIYKAKFTRPIMSVYEYVQTITTLAKYLQNQTSLSEFVDSEEINYFVNVSFLAFHLLDIGKWDAVLIRNNNEKITFSTLKQNPKWRELIIDLINKKNVSMEDEFKPILNLFEIN